MISWKLSTVCAAMAAAFVFWNPGESLSAQSSEPVANAAGSSTQTLGMMPSDATTSSGAEATGGQAAGMSGMMGAGHEQHVQQMMQQMSAQMNSMMTQGDPDVNFAMMMAHHHQGGIDMAREYLKHGKDKKLRAMAEKMIKEQEKQKKELEERQKADEQGGAASGRDEGESKERSESGKSRNSDKKND